MPEILTSVPNGCRWHKDVLAALEVHHVEILSCVDARFVVPGAGQCQVLRATL